MIHYIKPSYKIKKNREEIFKITVKADVSATPPKNIAVARKALLMRQATNDPLFTIAFINWMAKKGDKQAKNLRALYNSYKTSLRNGNVNELTNLCKSLLCHLKIDPLARDAASWILMTIENQRVPKKLHQAGKLLKLLFPSVQEFLSSKLIIKSEEPQCVTLPEIKSKHNAFPDLIKYHGRYYISFREAQSHVGHMDEGSIRILKGSFSPSTNTWSWTPSGSISKKGFDLRDPKFFIDGNNSLRLIIGASIINKKDKTTQMVPHVATLSHNEWILNKAEADPSCNGTLGQWIWRVTWNTHDNKGYALSYGQGSCVNVVSTNDGTCFTKIGEISLPPLTELNEGTIRFKNDGSAIALIRTRRNGIIAHSTPSSGYADWTCHRVPFRLGGPNILLDEKRNLIWVGTRYFFLNDDNTLDEATVLARMENNVIIPLIRLPSSYDCGYPGMVLEKDSSLTFTYYSSPLPSNSKIYICKCTTGFSL